MTTRILVIEDDADIAHLVALHLRDLSYEVECLSDGESGLAKALGEPFDLIILDLNLPKLDGLEVCRNLRAAGNQTPLLMLTARSSELDRVLGLELGADDYLSKPFSIKELVARAKAILRRAAGVAEALGKQASEIIDINGMTIDTARRSVLVDGQPVDLTAREFDLLLYFAQNPGHVYSRAHLLDRVWGYGHEGYEHTVNSHINRLRKKIERDPANARYILTVWGVGYRFSEPGPG